MLPALVLFLFRFWPGVGRIFILFLLSIKWQLKLLNYTFIEIYEFVNQNLWLGARQDHSAFSHAANDRKREREREKARTKEKRENAESAE